MRHGSRLFLVVIFLAGVAILLVGAVMALERLGLVLEGVASPPVCKEDLERRQWLALLVGSRWCKGV